MKYDLNVWSGSFVADGHRYFTADGVELQGVTGILKRRIFKDEYKGVSQEVLDNAAKRGSMIHSRLELYDTAGIGTDMPEVANYARLKAEYGLEWITSEYLVSDDEHYASAIDKVYHIKETPDDEVALGDVKTTYSFNREYVSWQLSIYAYFFEMLNPHKRVGRLFGIWLREDKKRGSIAKIIPVERKPVELVKELILCDIEDRDFNCTMLPSFITDNMDRLIFLNEKIKALSEEKDAIVASILEEMQKRSDKSIDSGPILFTRVEASTKRSFDSTKFKAEHADMYEKYMKESAVKEQLKVTIRN